MCQIRKDNVVYSSSREVLGPSIATPHLNPQKWALDWSDLLSMDVLSRSD